MGTLILGAFGFGYWKFHGHAWGYMGSFYHRHVSNLTTKQKETCKRLTDNKQCKSSNCHSKNHFQEPIFSFSFNFFLYVYRKTDKQKQNIMFLVLSEMEFIPFDCVL